MNKKRAIYGVLLSLAFLTCFAYTVSGMKFALQNNKQFLLGSMLDAPIADIREESKPVIPVPEINAQAFISVETNFYGQENVLLSKNSETILPIASLTKLMTAVIVLDNYKLSDRIKVAKNADLRDSIAPDVKTGTEMPVYDFLQVMLVGSSNKSAYALAGKIGEKKFIDLMNQKAKELGLANTFFGDPAGLSSKNVSSASDLVRLTEYILTNYPIIGEISRIKELNIYGIGSVKNTDQLLGQVPNIVCSKTGFTAEASGCLLVVTSNKNGDDYLINIILGTEDRFSEMTKMINWSGQVCE